MTARTVITISRQLGSGGAQVGQMIAERMNIKYVDHEILRLAAEALGLEEIELSRREERILSFWEKLTAAFCVTPPEAPFTPPPLTIPDEQLFKTESQIIKTIAERDDCVVVGRASRYVLRDHPGMLSIFLYAPVDFRIRRVMDIYSIPGQEQARAMIQKSDRDREAFVARLCSKDWMSAHNYDLCMNSSLLPLSDIADIVVNLARKKSLVPV